MKTDGFDMGSAPVCWIAPPEILIRVAESANAADREAAAKTLVASAALRARRTSITRMLRENLAAAAFVMPPSTGEQDTVYDVNHGGEWQLPGTKKRGETDPPNSDVAVNQAWDGADETFRFYESVFQRDSIDGQGMELVSTVHFGADFDNAFWDGSQMVYGDGSGRIFKVGGLTTAIDVMAHELTHGVTQHTAALEYSKQSGALNESCSDVMGSLVKQWTLRKDASQADWLIGDGTLGPAFDGGGSALRSMKDPGTANKFDNQPAHMKDYVDLPDDSDPHHDHGGVHINSGIPNRAFYLMATTLGGNAWERAGKIWYTTLTTKLSPTSDFQAFATATLEVAGEIGTDEQNAVRLAWEAVGVL